MLSVVIPSFKDPVLQQTIDGILLCAEGEIEIIAVIDGYELDKPLKEDPRVRVIKFEKNRGMRAAINAGVEASKGEYIIKSDEHCAYDRGFDIKLLSQIEANWVVSPIRYKLDTEKWELVNEPPIVYERIITDREDRISGVHWNARKVARQSIQIDENMVFQGSCWVMSRKHWNWLGGLSEHGYGKFAQEAIEICLKTWLGGGKVMVNKNTWYAHKDRKFRRPYHTNSPEIEKGNKYSMDYWLNNRWEERKYDLEWLMRRFGLKLRKWSPS